LTTTAPSSGPTRAAPDEAPAPELDHERRLLRAATWLREANPFVVTTLALAVGLLFGAILIIVTTPALLHSWAGVFSHPGATIALNAQTVWGAIELLFTGSIFDPRAVWAAIQHPNHANWANALTPISATLTYATPLILAGLGMAVSFRTSLFNIGGQGQLIGGAIGATAIGFSVSAPPVVLVSLEMLAAIVSGLLVGSVPGILKAYTGAHEVIVTIMMNYVMVYFLAYLVLLNGFKLPNESEGESKRIVVGGQLPKLLGWLNSSLQVNVGFLIAIAAVGVVAWFLNRSTTGFELQVVGANPEAARTAGVNSRRMIVLAMCISGALIGLAGMVQVTGIDTYLTGAYGGTIGFDAIVVALLGRNTPMGVLGAAFLFGALDAGGHQVQLYSTTNIDYSISLVIQAVIVFCVATPALIVALFRLKQPATARAALASGGWA
jgi:general nucleoside transport system permease protein